jgi:hypothetical protein
MRATIAVLFALGATSVVGLGTATNVAAHPSCQETCNDQRQICLKNAKTKPAQLACDSTAKTCDKHCSSAPK